MYKIDRTGGGGEGLKIVYFDVLKACTLSLLLNLSGRS